MITISLNCSEPSREYLIIEAKTGVKYSNQTGGYACNHPEVEGFLLPINLTLDCAEQGLLLNCYYMNADDESTTYTKEQLEEVKIFIDILNQSLYDSYLIDSKFKIDESRLNIMEEAWIPLISDKFKINDGSFITGKIKKPVRAILTWENSD